MLPVGSTVVNVEHSVVATPNILHGVSILKRKGGNLICEFAGLL